jgi:2,4-dienoyl-CoA reductase (NADPH2)
MGVRVAILEMRGSIGRGIEAITRRMLLRELRHRGVELLTRAKVVMIENEQVLYETADDVVQALPADLVALAIGWRPRGTLLAEELRDREVMVLGDASHAADFVAAINAGAAAGRAL